MIKTTKDGRTILSGKDYTRFRNELFCRQEGRCTRCRRFCVISADPQWDWSFHTHHQNGRGMGGSKRDDTFEACTGLCGKCHREAHNQ